MTNGSPDEEPKKRPSPPPVEFVRPADAPAPLPPRDQPPVAWVPRPEEDRRESWPGAPIRGPAVAGQRHLFAGIVLVLAALIGIGYTISLSFSFLSPSDYANVTKNLTVEEYALSQICFLSGVWAQLAALLGGVMAVQRLNWKLAMSCATFSLVTLGAVALAFADPWFGLSAIICLIGFVLVITARAEFFS